MNYCYQENRLAIFAEAACRGWLAGIRDFPRLKSHEDCIQAAYAIPDLISPVVCCIPADDFPYRQLVVSGYVASYRAVARGSERLATVEALALREMSEAEALEQIRARFFFGEAQEEVARGYAEFCEKRERMAG